MKFLWIGRSYTGKPTEAVVSKGWASDIAQVNFEKMIKLKGQPTSDGRMLTPDEICNMVLGTKPGYVRGVGHGEVCPSSSQSRRYSDMEDSGRRAEEAERKAEELARELLQNKNLGVRT